jgi:hypothetical protein
MIGSGLVEKLDRFVKLAGNPFPKRFVEDIPFLGIDIPRVFKYIAMDGNLAG